MNREKLPPIILAVAVLAFASILTANVTDGDAVIRKQSPVAGRYIVVLKDVADIDRVPQQLASAYSGVLQRVWKRLIPAFSIEMSDTQAQLLARNPNVLSVEEDSYGYISSNSDPDASWALARDGQRGTVASSGPYTFYYPAVPTGSGVRVYIVDTGVLGTHDEFQSGGSSRVEVGANFNFDDCTSGYGNDPLCAPHSTLSDQLIVGHGTSVASIMGGHTMGIARGAWIVPFRVVDHTGRTTMTYVMSALDYIISYHGGMPGLVNGPAVINCSWYDPQTDSNYSATTAVEREISKLIDDGFVVTASANNQHNTSGCTTKVPSRMPRVITVGGSAKEKDDNGTLKKDPLWICSGSCGLDYGSNYGPCVDVYAPAENLTLAGAMNDSDVRGSTNYGTSFAAPQVAALAALYLEIDPSASPATVYSWIVNSATTPTNSGNSNLLYNLTDPYSYKRLLFTNSVPLSSISPSSADAADSNTTVTLNGENLFSSPSLTFGGSSVTVTGIDSTDHAWLTFTRPSPLTAGTLYKVSFANSDSHDGEATLGRGFLADFTDVSASHGFHTYVEKIARNEITLGCGSGSFCATSSVTRAQMALFLVRALHGPLFAAPPAVAGVYDDIPAGDNVGNNAVIQLHTDGLANPCDPTHFCPTSTMLRNDYAKSVLIALHGPGWVPTLFACNGSSVFADVSPSDPYCDWINDLYAEGLTDGCASNPLRYCPTDPLNRLAVAKFITIAFHLQ